MTFDKTHRPPQNPAEVDTVRSVILAVGEVGVWRARGLDLPMDGQITFAEFHEVTSALLETVSPDVVLSPLLCGAFDCLDLAQVLKTLGFQGRYRAMAGSIPNPGVILSEVAACCPGLDFDLLKTDATTPPTMN